MTDFLCIDNTQKALIRYLIKTEQCVSELIHSIDKQGDVKILPAEDLGMPNNALRLKGGFATGMVMIWECSEPLVFIDATVNSCVSSVFETDIHEIPSEFLDERRIEDVIRKCVVNGYSFDIESGNHFLAFCQSERTKNINLVQHFSDKRAKDKREGLYPIKNVWYEDEIKTFFGKERWIRYLIGEPAERFYHLARKMEKRTKEAHRRILITKNCFFGNGGTLWNAQREYYKYRRVFVEKGKDTTSFYIEGKKDCTF